MGISLFRESSLGEPLLGVATVLRRAEAIVLCWDPAVWCGVRDAVLIVSLGGSSVDSKSKPDGLPCGFTDWVLRSVHRVWTGSSR
jgi:hypothetical protein